jgi:DDE family transposase/transposase-like protein DUF772
MAGPKVAPRSAASELSSLLDSPEIQVLIRELEETRWTGRPGYPIRTMVGMALAKSLYAIPTWTRAVRLVGEHRALQAALGCEDKVPSEWACYRFTRKLREHSDALARCLDRVTAGLHERLPKMGQNVAVDASDLPAYANGQRYVSKGGRERAPEEYSDPDASWGHRSAVSTRKGGGFYGYKIHMAVCADTDLPLAWRIETARRNESSFAIPLLDTVRARGFAAYKLAMDKGYDQAPIYAECEARDTRPVMPLRATPDVKRGDHRPPTCEHGEWRFAGSDSERGASKWRCPPGSASPRASGSPPVACTR